MLFTQERRRKKLWANEYPLGNEEKVQVVNDQTKKEWSRWDRYKLNEAVAKSYPQVFIMAYTRW